MIWIYALVKEFLKVIRHCFDVQRPERNLRERIRDVWSTYDTV